MWRLFAALGVAVAWRRVGSHASIADLPSREDVANLHLQYGAVFRALLVRSGGGAGDFGFLFLNGVEWKAVEPGCRAAKGYVLGDVVYLPCLAWPKDMWLTISPLCLFMVRSFVGDKLIGAGCCAWFFRSGSVHNGVPEMLLILGVLLGRGRWFFCHVFFSLVMPHIPLYCWVLLGFRPSRP
jgi:hypothetical protein